jgi:predicted nucleic acid-binding protein
VYLIDSNIFIEAKNRYYAFDLAPSFWDFMDAAFARADVGSISMVYEELAAGNDDLAAWVKARKSTSVFLDVSDANTQAIYASIANGLTVSTHYQPAGVARFLSGADPWIAAKAKVLGATVVTHELYDPYCKKRVPLGNVCHDEGVAIMDTFDFMRRLGAAL